MTRVTDRIFEGFAGLRLAIEPKRKAAGGPWIKVRVHKQNIYLDPATARDVAEMLKQLAQEVEH